MKFTSYFSLSLAIILLNPLSSSFAKDEKVLANLSFRKNTQAAHQRYPFNNRHASYLSEVVEKKFYSSLNIGQSIDLDLQAGIFDENTNSIQILIAPHLNNQEWTLLRSEVLNEVLARAGALSIARSIPSGIILEPASNVKGEEFMGGLIKNEIFTSSDIDVKLLERKEELASIGGQSGREGSKGQNGENGRGASGESLAHSEVDPWINIIYRTFSGDGPTTAGQKFPIPGATVIPQQELYPTSHLYLKYYFDDVYQVEGMRLINVGAHSASPKSIYIPPIYRSKVFKKWFRAVSGSEKAFPYDVSLVMHPEDEGNPRIQFNFPDEVDSSQISRFFSELAFRSSSYFNSSAEWALAHSSNTKEYVFKLSRAALIEAKSLKFFENDPVSIEVPAVVSKILTPGFSLEIFSPRHSSAAQTWIRSMFDHTISYFSQYPLEIRDEVNKVKVEMHLFGNGENGSLEVYFKFHYPKGFDSAVATEIQTSLNSVFKEVLRHRYDLAESGIQIYTKASPLEVNALFKRLVQSGFSEKHGIGEADFCRYIFHSGHGFQ